MSQQDSNKGSGKEVLADKAAAEKMLLELSKESLDDAGGGYSDEFYGSDYSSGFADNSYYGGNDYNFASYANYDDSSSYAANAPAQQVAEAHCMICGARCGSWGDGPVPTGSQGGRRIG